jgi:N-acetylmuramoyl-L-alanine amidase
MANKIFLSASDQFENAYAYGNTNEAEICRKIADACEVALKRCGFEVKNSKTNSYIERTKESNVWGSDAHIAIHTNAASVPVSGTRIFTYGNGSNETKLAQCMYDTLTPFIPGNSDGLSAYPDLYELKNTKMAACYLEVQFHHCADTAKWIIENVDGIAEKIAEGACKYFDAKYIAPKTSGKLYQAVAGSFSVKENCEKQIEKLNKAGFLAFMQIK